MNDEFNELDQEQLGKLSSEFLRTEYGRYFLSFMSTAHYNLHEASEKATTIEETALLVTEAKGLRTAIQELTVKAKQFEDGYFNEQRAEAEKAEELADIMP